MSLLDEITNTAMDGYSYALSVDQRPTPFFEYLGARAMRGMSESIIANIGRAAMEPGSVIEGSAAYAAERGGLSQWETDQLVEQTTRYLDIWTQDRWKNSPYYRPGLTWQDGQTGPTWAARADHYDASQFRDWQISNRRAAFWGEGAVGFSAELVGGAVDPINYIRFGGPAFRAALAARGLSRGFAHVVAQGIEASAATAAFEPFILHRRSLYGEDVGFATAVTDIAMGALTGT